MPVQNLLFVFQNIYGRNTGEKRWSKSFHWCIMCFSTGSMHQYASRYLMIITHPFSIVAITWCVRWCFTPDLTHTFITPIAPVTTKIRERCLMLLIIYFQVHAIRTQIVRRIAVRWVPSRFKNYLIFLFRRDVKSEKIVFSSLSSSSFMLGKLWKLFSALNLFMLSKDDHLRLVPDLSDQLWRITHPEHSFARMKLIHLEFWVGTDFSKKYMVLRLTHQHVRQPFMAAQKIWNLRYTQWLWHLSCFTLFFLRENVL